MIYKCKNCDGNMVYHVEERKLYCIYCNAMDTEQLVEDLDMYRCDSCGGELNIGEYDSTGKCPYCSQYVIYRGRIEGEYEPAKMIPFKVGKEQAKTMIRLKYRSKWYAPKSFLAKTNLEKIEGIYVPFWLYDFNVNVSFRGTGMRERMVSDEKTAYQKWASYDVRRKFDMAFRKMPVDASKAMPDEIMDLLEPYEYRELVTFNPKYMSGYYGEIYFVNAKGLENRVQKKVQRIVQKILDDQLSSFKMVIPIEEKRNIIPKGEEYVLLPVWKYIYTYQGETYEYYVNGQTGKVIGEAPFLKGKMIISVSLVAIISLLVSALELWRMFGIGLGFYLGAPVLSIFLTGIYIFSTWPKAEKYSITEKDFAGCLRMKDAEDILK